MPTRTKKSPKPVPPSGPTSAPAPADPAEPVIVFFGEKHAGKSTLLHAFLQDIAPAEPVDDLKPVSPPDSVRREIVKHAVRTRTTASGTGEPVVLIDCDGRSAGDMLAAPGRAGAASARGSLWTAIRSADALVLVIEAVATEADVDKAFRSFRAFLDALQNDRNYQREVGGLPIFLTLTKCDALAEAGDDFRAWSTRVGDRKRVIQAQFQDFFGYELAGDDDPTTIDPSPFLAFGSLDLQVTATVARASGPKTTPLAFLPEGEFGIRELAVDCLRAAKAYNRRARRAWWRLKYTLVGLIGVIALLFVGALTLSTTGAYGPADALAARITEFRAREGPPAERLSDPAIAANQQAVDQFANSPVFDRIPPELKTYIADRQAEYAAYAEYRSRFKPPRLAPQDLRTREEGDRLAASLGTDLAPPAAYADAWKDTTASRMRQKWLTDLGLMTTAEEALYAWYRGLDRRATDLLFVDRPPDYGWRQEATALFARASVPPFDPNEVMPGSPEVPAVPRADPLTYAPAFAFDRVLLARRDWEDAHGRLTDLRDLTDVLGITAGPSAVAPPFLDLPEPTSPAESLTEAADRLALLVAAFPEADPAHPDWAAVNFPDPVRRWLEPRLRSEFETGVRHVRGLIVDRLRPPGDPNGPPQDTLAGWRSLNDGWLAEPPMKAWGRLLGRLRRWAALPGTDDDPVAELAGFLGRDSYPFDLRAVEIAVPDDLLDRTARPSGEFTITVTPSAGGPSRTLRFRSVGAPRYDRPLSVHLFEPVDPPGAFEYSPGDGFVAELPLKAGGQTYKLVWSGGRSAVYQFDALAQPPVLVRGGPIPFPPERAADVRVIPVPADGLPTVPELLPRVRPRTD